MGSDYVGVVDYLIFYIQRFCFLCCLDLGDWYFVCWVVFLYVVNFVVGFVGGQGYQFICWNICFISFYVVDENGVLIGFKVEVFLNVDFWQQYVVVVRNYLLYVVNLLGEWVILCFVYQCYQFVIEV